MDAAGLTLARKQRLHRRALRLEYFTVSWNVIEAVVAITAGVIAGSVALIGFGVDSGFEVISAIALLWRLRTAGVDADASDEEHAERRALYAVAATFFLLAAYIGFEATTPSGTAKSPTPRPSASCSRSYRWQSCPRWPTPSSAQAARWAAALSRPTRPKHGSAPTSQ